MTGIQWLGVLIAASPIAIVLAVIAREAGLLYAAIVLALALVTIGVVVLGTYLIRTGGVV